MTHLLLTTETKKEALRNHLIELTDPRTLLINYENQFGCNDNMRSHLEETRLAITDAMINKNYHRVEEQSLYLHQLEDKMRQKLIDLEITLFRQCQHMIIEPHEKKPRMDSYFTTINLSPRPTGEKMIEIMNCLRLNCFAKNKLKDNIYAIEFASKTKENHGYNTHAHWLYKTTYSKLRPGGFVITDNYNPNDRSATGIVARCLTKYYPQYKFDIRTDSSIYENRKKYVIKEEIYPSNNKKIIS